jgi:hypothetical protein
MRVTGNGRLCLSRHAPKLNESATPTNPTSGASAPSTVGPRKTLAAVTTERNQLRRALAQVAEDCTAWLHNENDEPAVEFIKAVRTYAHEQSQAPLAPSS